ncbi:YtxH domain-containing protein [Gracilibacillus salitolerans]|uniref:YtxH domain-containing protein n=1 Tax=Gracilibacillus salitolerans TaxID=2663022 RepID=A0A5Q2TKT1_9BACI|nr:YtxH domain-containing protein [Gracilibacillus salitolerans]QGH35356.1 YtxH domain-containing protein [Gracilibacillus salitolerans]
MTNQNQYQNEENQNINSKDFLIGSLIGGIVGASLALIFAPKSGKELRGDLNQGAHYVKDRANEWKDVAYEKSGEWRDYAKEQSQQLGNTVSEKSQDLTSKLKETKATIQEKIAKDEDPEKAAEEVAQAIEEAAQAVEDENNTNV